MPTIRREEKVIDTAFEQDTELIERLNGIFRELRREAEQNADAAKIIRVEANALARRLSNEHENV